MATILAKAASRTQVPQTNDHAVSHWHRSSDEGLHRHQGDLFKTRSNVIPWARLREHAFSPSDQVLFSLSCQIYKDYPSKSTSTPVQILMSVHTGATYAHSHFALTRHKRTCGDSCVLLLCRRSGPNSLSFISTEIRTNRGANRAKNKKFTSKKPASLSTVIAKPPPDTDSTIFPPALIEDGSLGSPPYSTLYPLGAGSPSPPLSFDPSLSKTQFETTSLGLGLSGLSDSSQSSSSSSCSSSPSDLFEIPVSIASAFDLDFQALEIDPHLHQLFSRDGFDTPLIDDSISPCSPELGFHGDYEGWIDGRDTTSLYGNEENISSVYSHPAGKSGAAVHDLSTLEMGPISDCSVSGHQSVMPMVPYDPSGLKYGNEVSTEELNQYLFMFFSAFCIQIPIIHHPTWRMEGKPTILVRAMQACGALFVKGYTASDFINQTLVVSREALILEFSKPACSLKDQVSLILAAVLLQSIGLLKQPHQGSSTNMYHEILVLMIRRTGLIKLLTSWTPPDLTNSYNLDGSWADWARYETLKRAVFLAYVQDCSNCVNFSSTPSFHPSEFQVNLPCDDTLWNAGSVNEWFQALQTPSPYGTGQIRLSGLPAQVAFVSLNEGGSAVPSLSLNPFSNLILIYTVLRDIFSCPSQDSFLGDASRTPPNILSSQYQLHNWLRLWTDGPEATRLEKNGTEVPYICDALPLYWLAHFSLMSMQDATLQTGPSSPEDGTGDRYNLLRGWLDHIKLCLRNGSQLLPGQLPADVSKSRLPGWQEPEGQAPLTHAFSSNDIFRSFVD